MPVSNRDTGLVTCDVGAELPAKILPGQRPVAHTVRAATPASPQRLLMQRRWCSGPVQTWNRRSRRWSKGGRAAAAPALFAYSVAAPPGESRATRATMKFWGQSDHAGCLPLDSSF